MQAITPSATFETGPLARFSENLRGGDVLEKLRAGLIGAGTMIEGPFGPQKLVYADYVASGRGLMQVEAFILNEVLPFYSNSHTEASYCGSFMTRLRRDARAAIGACCGADDDHAVIFAGSGATAGLNRLVTLLGVNDAVANGRTARVIIGPYEHHSNILPWRESGAEVVEIPECADGSPDLEALERVLQESAGIECLVCSFSAASNVTGILTDVPAVTRLAKAAGAAMIWDYAGAGPYIPISMTPAPDAEIDAVVISPHKFIGGPGASGVLIVRRDAVRSTKPSWPGGGTVKFVSPASHDYSDSLEAREEAGTPNVLGDIRAALVFLVKEALGSEATASRNAELTERALAAWAGADRIEILGSTSVQRLPIFSIRVRDSKGDLVHQQLVTRMLSDRYGIQARGGCACAGPYVHRLLSIDAEESERIRQQILSGAETEKPGFTRLNFSVLLPEDKIEFILRSVLELAGDAEKLVPGYDVDPRRAIFFPRVA